MSVTVHDTLQPAGSLYAPNCLGVVAFWRGTLLNLATFTVILFKVGSFVCFFHFFGIRLTPNVVVLILRQDDISGSILSQSHQHPGSPGSKHPGVPKKCEDFLLVQTQHAVLRKTPPPKKAIYNTTKNLQYISV